MEIKLELDLPSIIAKAVSAERIQPIVEKAISDVVKSAIDEATGYRSDFRKRVTEQLTAVLPHGLALDDVAKFQHVLNDAMRKFVHDANNAAVVTAIDQAVKSVMPDVPAVIKMSELIDMARESFGKSEQEAFYAHFHSSSSGGGWLYLDSDPNPGRNSTYTSSSRPREDRKYDATYCFAFTDDGQVYSLKMKNQVVTPATRPNIITPFDATLMAMYVGRTSIEADMDDADVESAAGGQWD